MSFLRHRTSLLLVAFLSFLGTLPAFSAEEGAKGGMSLLHVIVDGGPLIIFIWLCILGTSVVMVTFIIQNALTMKKAKIAPPPLVETLRQQIAQGNYQEAWATCAANENYLSNVLKAGLTRIGRGKDAVEAAVAEHGLREATALRTRNSYLSVIGVVSPMIGLLGTVIGMLGAFEVLATSGVADPKALSGKIGEVLTATAAGLFIAIPAFVAYYVFRNVSQMCLVHGDDIVNELLIDIPYSELEGIQIGQTYGGAAGLPYAPAGVALGGGMPLGVAPQMTGCPVCSNAVAVGSNPCPHCGATLNWGA
jgi:biopolymer transport protein ExbB